MDDLRQSMDELLRRTLNAKFQEFRDDERWYAETQDVTKLNVARMCGTKQGVIIAGEKGCGKTAVIRKFAQQNLNEVFGIDGVKIIQLNNMFWRTMQSEDAAISNISEFGNQYKNSAVIAYAKFNSLEMLYKSVSFFQDYLEKVKTIFNMKMLKIIFEITINSENEQQQLSQRCDNEFSIVRISEPQNIDDFVERIRPRIDEFSVYYEVDYSTEMMLFYIALVDGWIQRKADMNQYISELEKVFVLASQNGKRELSREIATILYPQSFEYLQRVNKEVLLTTAYHESGHTLIRLLQNKFFKIRYVSIVPTDGFNGVTCYETVFKKIPSKYKTKDAHIDFVVGVLAGRVAERLFNSYNELNAGAASDLKMAMGIVNDMVYKFGFSEVLGKNYVVRENEPLSEELRGKVEKEKREILDKAEARAFSLIQKHQEFVEKLAVRLTEELIVSGEDVHKMWEEYLKEI